MTRRRAVVAFAGVAILGGLLFARSLALAGFEVLGAPPLTLQPLDLGSPREIEWQLPQDRAGREGEVRLALVVSRECPLERGGPLRLRVSAKGRVESGQEFDRRIRNWYYVAEEPLDRDAHIWESGRGDSREFGLAGVMIYPFEQIRITVEVVTGDPRINTCQPRLELRPAYDYALEEHLPQLRLLRDAMFTALVSLLGVLVWLAWRESPREAAADDATARNGPRS